MSRLARRLSFAPRRAGAIVLFLLALSGSVSRADPAPRAEPPPSPRWLVPSLHCAGIELAARISLSLIWPDTFDLTRVHRNWASFKSSWSSAPELDPRERFFEWDHDPWALNLIGHGLMGSEFYLRHRQGHHPFWLALLMTAAWTVTWEYFIESWHKHPSGIDLLWTPLGGLLIGEGRYRLYLLIRNRRPSRGRTVLLYLVDPLGQLERDLLGLRF